MSNTLKTTREEIKVILNAVGVGVVGHIPGRIAPPTAIVEPGSPYMEMGETFSDFNVRMNVVLLAGAAGNEVATDELDQLICTAVDALDTFDIEAVEQPEAFEINGAQYLGARIRLLANKDLKT